MKSASNISKLCIAITFIAGYAAEKSISDLQKAGLTFDYTAMLGEPFAGEDS